MRTMLQLFIVGLAILLTLKLLGALLAVFLPLFLVGMVLAVPVALVAMLGWGVLAFFRGITGGTAGTEA